MATALYRFPATKELTDATEAKRPAVVIAPADTLSQFSLAPLSAGDIIDRAVRMYRRHLLAFIRIVLPPSLLAFAGSIMWTTGLRNISFEHGDARMFAMGTAIAVGLIMWVIGKAGFLMVMGAASRALVYHFFNGTPLLARDVYRAVRERIWGLLGATIVLFFFTLVMISAGYLIFALLIGIYAIAVMTLTQVLPAWLMMSMHVIFGLLSSLLLIVMLLIAYTRVIYTPPAMMVEGKGVFEAFGRSFTLGGGYAFVKVGLVLLFQLCVAWAIYTLLLVPLGWYSYFHSSEGLSVTSLFDTSGPLWFIIAQQTLTQLGEILIAPIVLLSFTLLYLDSRVRKEGFDVELLANRILPRARYEQRAAVPAFAPVESAPIYRPDIDWSEELANETEAEAVVARTASPLIESPQPELPFIEIPETTTISLAPINISPANEVEKELAARFCSNCGAEVGERARFCASCGEKL